MDERLAGAIELVVHDLKAAAGLPFALSEDSPVAGDEPDLVSLLFEIGVGGAVLQVWPEGGLGEQLGDLLEVIQQEVLEARAEAGLWAYWPRCPWHPRSHPLISSQEATPRWVCPADGRRTDWNVGELPRGQTPP